MASIRVVLIDDHAIVREGMRALLGSEPALEIVGEADDGPSALHLVGELKPDVAMVDLALPGLDGIEVTRRLRASHPQVRVIILTGSFDHRAQVPKAIQAGATGYLIKSMRRAELVQAVRNAAHGQTTLHPEAQQALIEAASTPPPPHQALTPREHQVLMLIAGGQSNKAIAAQLHLSEGTIKGYVSTVLSKLGVDDRTQAALYAHHQGLAGKRRCA